MKPHHYEQELAGWLVSGYCVYSAAGRCSTGDWLAAATMLVADRVVSPRLSETQIADLREPCQLSLGIIELGWTLDRRNCHLAYAMMDDLINLGSEKSGCLVLKSCSASWPRVFIPPSFSSCILPSAARRLLN